MTIRSKLAAILKGYGYLTLDPSPRLRRLREQSEAQVRRWEE